MARPFQPASPVTTGVAATLPNQLIRNIRVGLHRCGYFRTDDQLFDQPPRDFIVLVLSPIKGHSLVDQYRDPENLRSAIPKAERLRGLPRGPFVGQLDYNDITTVLEGQSRWMTAPERRCRSRPDQLSGFQASWCAEQVHLDDKDHPTFLIATCFQELSDAPA